MTALQNHANISTKQGELVSYKVAATTTIYMGSLVAVNATGFLEPCAANVASQTFVGIAADGTLAQGATDGAVSIPVFRKGLFELTVTGVDQAHVGLPVYVTDDATLTVTAPATPVTVGHLIQVSATTGKGWVELV